MTRRLPASAAALAVVLASAGPAAAAPPVAATLRTYWRNFVDFWLGSIRHQDGVVLVAVGAGVAGVLLISSGKWIR